MWVFISAAFQTILSLMFISINIYFETMARDLCKWFGTNYYILHENKLGSGLFHVIVSVTLYCDTQTIECHEAAYQLHQHHVNFIWHLSFHNMAYNLSTWNPIWSWPKDREVPSGEKLIGLLRSILNIFFFYWSGSNTAQHPEKSMPTLKYHAQSYPWLLVCLSIHLPDHRPLVTFGIPLCRIAFVPYFSIV